MTYTKEYMLPLGYHKDDYLRKGMQFTIDIPKIEVEKFAMILLHLTNMRSSGSLKLLDFRTFMGTNTIRVIFEGVDKEKPMRYLKAVVEECADYEPLEFQVVYDGPIEVVDIDFMCFDDTDLVDDMSNVYIKGDFC